MATEPERAARQASPGQPERPHEAPNVVELWLDEVGDYLRSHNLRALEMGDKSGRLIWPKPK